MRIEKTDSMVVPLKMWTDGVPVEDAAIEQMRKICSLPFLHHHAALMPDAHFGIGATVGSVLATKGAIIPSAVGVDIGCGMAAVETTLKASDLPDNLSEIRSDIERAVPHGVVTVAGRSTRGSWDAAPGSVVTKWSHLLSRFEAIARKHKRLALKSPLSQLGTLGGGNHFIELCLDERQAVWIMLHSGSRGVGNQIGQHFIEMARDDMRRHFINLPDRDMAYLVEGTDHFDDYFEAMSWAQDYAFASRESMMDGVLRVLRARLVPFKTGGIAVNCHHNYASRERHYGSDVIVTRKGAVRARLGELGIIPGSMGAKSFIVRGKGSRESFESCSHGAGRTMSRTEAKKRFTIEEHITATEGVECKKDDSVLDETPMAYKNIDDVMAAQMDLVEIVATLKQVLCVKG
jgi:tRNA-splicing ligase RtcB